LQSRNDDALRHRNRSTSICHCAALTQSVKRSPGNCQLRSSLDHVLPKWTTDSGDGFLWTGNFCASTTTSRTSLEDEQIRRWELLLTLNGQTSRQCPATLQLLHPFNIQVLILPNHTSHILQMFDIVLVALLKRTLSGFLRRNQRTDTLQLNDY